jgi:hypothetical protein
MLNLNALDRARPLLESRAAEFEARLRDGDSGAWDAYLATISALAAVTAQTGAGSRGELLTTRQLAERLNVSVKTVLRRKKTGGLKPAVQLGRRALRWNPEGPR